MRVVLTDAAENALGRARAEFGTDLSFVIGNGCCDSTAPFLFSRYAAGRGERRIDEVSGVPVFLDAALAELFDGREVVIDARDAVAADEGDSFSCETELGLRFTLDRLPAPG